MSKGYAVPADVSAFMGLTFTAAQTTLCGLAIGAAEEWIDENIHHAWLETSPVTETIRDPNSMYLRLAKSPIVSVTSLSVRVVPGCDPIPLVAESTFFVQNTKDGRIYSPYTYAAYEVIVVYTANSDPVPDDVHLATTIIAASHMRMMPTFLDGVDPALVQSYQVGGELTVEFRKNLLLGGQVPQQALNVLAQWLRNYAIV